MRGLAWLLLVPFAASLLFGVAAPRLAGRLTPRAATWLLSVGAATLSAGTIAAAGLVVLILGGETSTVAEHGHWSVHHLEASQPFGPAVAVAGVVAVALQGAALLRSGSRHGRLLGRAWWASHRSTTSLVVIDDPHPAAYAVPGWPGRIVTTAGLLATFDPAERKVVLAHEQAHLDGHHDLHLTAAALAVAVNPLLARVAGALQLATERWADEVAAHAVGDRRLVAATIVRAATTVPNPPAHLLTFGAARHQVVRRVAALLDAPAHRHPLVEATTWAVIGLTVVATALSIHETKQLFEAAERALQLPTATR